MQSGQICSAFCCSCPKLEEQARGIGKSHCLYNDFFLKKRGKTTRMEQAKVYTVGYAADDSAQLLEQVMSDPTMLLIDIRLVPRSRWFVQWNKKQLVERWGNRYRHERRLGNLNYKNRRKPIELRDAAGGIAFLVELLQAGYSVVLLCACVQYETCHRKFVAELLLYRLAQIATHEG